MELTTNQVKKAAKLGNLPTTKEEEEKYSGQISKILDYIGQLSSVNTTGVDPIYNVTGLTNIMRPDDASESLPQEESLQNAANEKNGYFVTKGIFDEE